MHKLTTALKLLLLGLRLGTTTKDKCTLAAFLLRSRLLRSSNVESRFFTIKTGRRTIKVGVRNNFADAFILNEAFVAHDYDKGLPVSPPKIIFDVGANVGYVTLYFASLYPDAKIFCFEPDPENYKQLQINTKNNSNITCYQVGIGSRTETKSFYRDAHFHMRNSLIKEEGMEEISISLISLEEAMERAAVTTVDLLKFDVEGAEKEFVPSFGNFKAIRSVVGELHPHLMSNAEYQQIVDILHTHYTLTIEAADAKKVFFYGTLK